MKNRLEKIIDQLWEQCDTIDEFKELLKGAIISHPPAGLWGWCIRRLTTRLKARNKEVIRLNQEVKRLEKMANNAMSEISLVNAYADSLRCELEEEQERSYFARTSITDLRQRLEQLQIEFEFEKMKSEAADKIRHHLNTARDMDFMPVYEYLSRTNKTGKPHHPHFWLIGDSLSEIFNFVVLPLKDSNE